MRYLWIALILFLLPQQSFAWVVYNGGGISEGDSPTFDHITSYYSLTVGDAPPANTGVYTDGAAPYTRWNFNTDRQIYLGWDGNVGGYLNSSYIAPISINGGGGGVVLGDNTLSTGASGSRSGVRHYGSWGGQGGIEIGDRVPGPFVIGAAARLADTETNSIHLEGGDAFASASTNLDGGDVVLRGGNHADAGGRHGVVSLESYTTIAARFGNNTSFFYPESENPIVISPGTITASIFSPYSTTTAPTILLTSTDTAWNCDVTNNDVTFTLYSSGQATQGNSVEIAVTKPSGDKTCFVTAHGNQTVRSGSIAFDNHSGMDTDGEAFKYYDTGRGYFMIHGGY